MSRVDEGRGWIIAIATFRVAKALVLLAASAGAFTLLNLDVPPFFERLIEWAEVGRPKMSDGVLLGVGLGAPLYAALFLAEGYGLFRGRLWAEWLTIIATTSFIPFEIYELAKEVTPLRIAALVANVAIVGYLVYRRVRDHRKGAQRNTRSRGAAFAQSM